MTEIIRVSLKSTVSSRAEASPLLKVPGDAVLIERGRPRLLVLACPCGCGEHVPVNLDTRLGPAWHYYMPHKGGMSLFPSVWRESGCRSHFIIWRNQIWLLGRGDETVDDDRYTADGVPTREDVLSLLPNAGFVPFSKIAERLNAVPWDVLSVCRRLVSEGKAVEGRDKQRGQFRRI